MELVIGFLSAGALESSRNGRRLRGESYPFTGGGAAHHELIVMIPVLDQETSTKFVFITVG